MEERRGGERGGDGKINTEEDIESRRNEHKDGQSHRSIWVLSRER